MATQVVPSKYDNKHPRAHMPLLSDFHFHHFNFSMGKNDGYLIVVLI